MLREGHFKVEGITLFAKVISHYYLSQSNFDSPNLYFHQIINHFQLLESIRFQVFSQHI